MTLTVGVTDQRSPGPGREDVFASLRADLPAALDERQRKGRETYGADSLYTFNGRDAERDLEDELLDALAYARQAALERAELIRIIDRLQNRIDKVARIATCDRHLLFPMDACDWCVISDILAGGMDDE